MIKAWLLVVISGVIGEPTTVEMKEFNTRDQCVHVGREVEVMDKHYIRAKCINISGKFESVDIPRSRGY